MMNERGIKRHCLADLPVAVMPEDFGKIPPLIGVPVYVLPILFPALGPVVAAFLAFMTGKWLASNGLAATPPWNEVDGIIWLGGIMCLSIGNVLFHRRIFSFMEARIISQVRLSDSPKPAREALMLVSTSKLKYELQQKDEGIDGASGVAWSRDLAYLSLGGGACLIALKFVNDAMGAPVNPFALAFAICVGVVVLSLLQLVRSKPLSRIG